MKKLLCYFDIDARDLFVDHTDEDGKTRKILSTPHNFVSANEKLARMIEIESEEDIKNHVDEGYSYFKISNKTQVQTGTGVVYDEAEKCYRASYYGFVRLNGPTLEVISACYVGPENLEAYCYIYPTKFNKIVSYNDIEEYFHDYQITTGYSKEKVDKILNNYDISSKRFSRLKIAKGKEAVPGSPEIYELIINADKTAGKIKSDGSINYKLVNSIIHVKEGDEILKKTPEIIPQEGVDIYGEKILALSDNITGKIPVENITESSEKKDVFVSSIEGCLTIINNQVSVQPLIDIAGDINYETGNVDYGGTIHVAGSVLSGFSITGGGDVIVDGTIEEATVEAVGNISTASGIIGNESVHIISGGDLTAKFIQNAHVECLGEIMVEDSIINSNVYGHNDINVVSKRGTIIGGTVTAKNNITVNTAGGSHGTKTVIIAGKNILLEHELYMNNEVLKNEKDILSEVVDAIKGKYGEKIIVDPQKWIPSLPPDQRKDCLGLIKEMNSINKKIKILEEKYVEFTEQIASIRYPTVTIFNKVFPGVEIHIKDFIRHVDEELSNVKFYYDREKNDIAFSSAK